MIVGDSVLHEQGARKVRTVCDPPYRAPRRGALDRVEPRSRYSRPRSAAHRVYPPSDCEQVADMADRVFRDRRDAGRVLARLLEHYRDEPDVVVLALPRGGVPVAYEVATALQAPL